MTEFVTPGMALITTNLKRNSNKPNAVLLNAEFSRHPGVDLYLSSLPPAFLHIPEVPLVHSNFTIGGWNPSRNQEIEIFVEKKGCDDESGEGVPSRIYLGMGNIAFNFRHHKILTVMSDDDIAAVLSPCKKTGIPSPFDAAYVSLHEKYTKTSISSKLEENQRKEAARLMKLKNAECLKKLEEGIEPEVKSRKKSKKRKRGERGDLKQREDQQTKEGISDPKEKTGKLNDPEKLGGDGEKGSEQVKKPTNGMAKILKELEGSSRSETESLEESEPEQNKKRVKRLKKKGGERKKEKKRANELDEIQKKEKAAKDLENRKKEALRLKEAQEEQRREAKKKQAEEAKLRAAQLAEREENRERERKRLQDTVAKRKEVQRLKELEEREKRAKREKELEEERQKEVQRLKEINEARRKKQIEERRRLEERRLKQEAEQAKINQRLKEEEEQRQLETRRAMEAEKQRREAKRLKELEEMEKAEAKMKAEEEARQNLLKSQQQQRNGVNGSEGDSNGLPSPSPESEEPEDNHYSDASENDDGFELFADGSIEDLMGPDTISTSPNVAPVRVRTLYH